MVNRAQIVAHLRREPLRNIVLLKHLDTYPNATRLHHVQNGTKAATMVLLDTAESAYDRRAYPMTSLVAMISSDDPMLTGRLLTAIPGEVGVVFKLGEAADVRLVGARYAVRQTTAVLSFTGGEDFVDEEGVTITAHPPEGVLALFESQQHTRAWLQPLLARDEAYVCVAGAVDDPDAVCFAFANFASVWEVGGVITPMHKRRQGHAARVVRAAVAELHRRGLVPRYQVHVENQASIALAEAVGLRRFLTITHLVREPAYAVSEANAGPTDVMRPT